MKNSAFSVFAPRVEIALGALGMTQDQPHIPRLLAYLDQLHHWNKTYNLTSIRDPEQMLVQHLFDSLAVLPVLRRSVRGRTLRIADVGSGAGLPGIILAICEPEWEVVCIDAVAKKMAFIQQVGGILGLHKLRGIHARVESVPPLQMDGVISRAFASLEDFVTLSARHCRQGGTLWAMKGRYPEDEVRALESATDWAVSKYYDLKVPMLDAQRCLLELTLKETP